MLHWAAVNVPIITILIGRPRVNSPNNPRFFTAYNRKLNIILAKLYNININIIYVLVWTINNNNNCFQYWQQNYTLLIRSRIQHFFFLLHKNTQFFINISEIGRNSLFPARKFCKNIITRDAGLIWWKSMLVSTELIYVSIYNQSITAFCTSILPILRNLKTQN